MPYINKLTTIPKKLKTYPIFSVFGIELEYCIVDKNTFEIKSFARKLFKILNSKNTYIYKNITITNEMVDHVLEIKPTNPYSNFKELNNEFQECLKFLNKILECYKLVLLPLSFHPTMKPNEAHIWTGKERSIYKTYDRLFGFNTHSFSNMQSLQITFPFQTEKEMIKLHNSIRLVLPLLKYLSASSPYFEGKINGKISNRIFYFENSQAKLDAKLSSPITDFLNNKQDYLNYLNKLLNICNSYNVKNIKPQWFNSQGSMIKFNFSAIEIRTCDIQESIHSNLLLSEFIFNFVKYIYYNLENLYIDSNILYEMFLEDTIKKEYLKLFNFNENLSIEEFIKEISLKINIFLPENNLSKRLLNKFNTFSKNVFLEILNASNNNIKVTLL